MEDKKYDVVIKGFSIVETGTGAPFAKGGKLVYSGMSYTQVCQMEAKLLGAFVDLNKDAQAAVAPTPASA